MYYRRNPFMKDKAVAVIFLATLIVLSQKFSVDCGTLLSSLRSQRFYNTQDGKVCYYCSPGQYKVEDCVNTSEVARCKPCENGTFQTVENIALSCAHCTTDCSQLNQEVIAVCNATTDNICQCISGYFKLNEEGVCKKHSTCPPGQGVKSPGNKDRNTVCENCVTGKTFSGNNSATEVCMPCTSCERQGLIETSPCTTRSNSECNFTVTPGQSDKQDNLGAVIGGIIGGVVVAAIITVATVCYCRRRLKKYERCSNDSKGEKEKNQYTLNSTINSIEKNPDQDKCINYQRKNSRQSSAGLRHSQDSNVTAESGYMSTNVNPSPGQGNLLDEDRAMVHMNDTDITISLLQKLSQDLISHDWKFFFRCLSVTESEIEQVEIDHRNVREQIYQLLCRLKQRGSLQMENIIESLISIGRNDLADSYKQVF
ncbi:hypothetical protein ACJMK2_008194 [Sinanodonta woodiana]|uniref:Uncharacterized protein n=1 Tax=Sinanodonta woodiana TaxID=1069815 RepID=A0ABD3VNV2_SINWO